MRVTSAVGYEAATVNGIAREAGCSRREFNRHFRDKESAFEVGYREITQDLREAVQAAYDAHDAPIGRTWACLEALAEFIASDPRRAEVLVIHGHAAGEGTSAVHCETMRRLVDLILANTADLPQPPGDPRLVAETVAGGIHEIVFARTARGEVRTLPVQVPEWAVAVMAPYVAIAAGEPLKRPPTGPTSKILEREVESPAGG